MYQPTITRTAESTLRALHKEVMDILSGTFDPDVIEAMHRLGAIFAECGMPLTQTVTFSFDVSVEVTVDEVPIGANLQEIAYNFSASSVEVENELLDNLNWETSGIDVPGVAEWNVE